MKTFAPDYYPEFRCIADRCRHSCCIGWEIDVDPDTREEYRRVPGAFGARLNAAIDDSGETACFRMDEHERCPMLNENGLCDLITELGEDALCDICYIHPRFDNAFTHRMEVGVGMCCESAARLILSRDTPMELIEVTDDEEEEPEDPDVIAVENSLLGLRDVMIGRMQDRSLPVLERVEWMLQDWNPQMLGRDVPDWVALYRGLERLDPAWDAVLDGLTDGMALPPEELEIAFEQFGVYMLYRHVPSALKDGWEDYDHVSWFKLAGYSTAFLFFLCAAHMEKHGTCTLEDCIEYARMYSAEVEYSEDNIAALLDAFSKEE